EGLAWLSRSAVHEAMGRGAEPCPGVPAALNQWEVAIARRMPAARPADARRAVDPGGEDDLAGLTNSEATDLDSAGYEGRIHPGIRDDLTLLAAEHLGHDLSELRHQLEATSRQPLAAGHGGALRRQLEVESEPVELGQLCVGILGRRHLSIPLALNQWIRAGHEAE